MKKLSLLIIILLSFKAVYPFNIYSSGSIPENLRKNANAVIRKDHVRFELISTKETTTKVHYIVTVLNSSANHLAAFIEHYSSYVDISSFEGALYDANGKQIRKVRKKDLSDLSAVQESNLMDDYRVKAFDFYHRSYPYTVEFIYEKKNKMSFFFPQWYSVPGEKISTQDSKFEFLTPDNYKFRYKAFNYDKEPAVTKEKNKNLYTWQVNNQEAVIRKPLSPGFNELIPMVIFAPTDFQIDNYTGNMASWNDFGKFIYSLNKGRDELPENTKSKVNQLISGVNDPYEKIRILYEFMQQNTRYISIQLGIGGWQPHTAEFVTQKGYGDCKALTNYMHSLLKHAGIKSNYSLIKAGDGAYNLNVDFPSNQFNHAILAVPVENDTVWLECTSQILPAGYLGGHTDNRPALLIHENGGTLVKTKTYGKEDNLQVRVIEGEIDNNGTLKLKAKNYYTGLQQDDYHSMINALSRDKVKEILNHNFNLVTYDVNEFKYDEVKGLIPQINENLDLNVYKYATITGKRMFVQPNVLTRGGTKFDPDPDRKEDFILNFEYRDIDSVRIKIPEGYEVEYKPDDVTLKTEFSNYSSSLKIIDNEIFYTRKIEVAAGRFPGEKFKSLADFHEAVFKADRERIVLRKIE